MEGKTRDYTLAMLDLLGQFEKQKIGNTSSSHQGEFWKKMESQLESIRYGGKTLTEAEINQLEKIVGNCLNEQQSAYEETLE